MPPRPPIDALAIDLDGTLLSPDATVSERNRAAVARARDAGITVLVCTGRGLAESRRALDAIGQLDPVVVAGGSIVADPTTAATLHRATIHTDIVRAATDIFHSERVPALVLKDPADLDYDYLVLEGAQRHPLDATTKWWFGEHKLRVRTGAHTHDDEHPEHTVRVGMCAVGSISARAARAAEKKLGDSIVMHDFAAVHPQDHAAEITHILELFSPSATKWGGIEWICKDRNLDPARIAAIGDEINDLTMIENAGLSVAMGNAKPAIKQAAHYHTGTNAESGVADAIDHILSGRWAPR